MSDQTQPANPLAVQATTLKAVGQPILLYVLLAVIATVLVMDRFRPSAPGPAVPTAAVDAHFVELAKAVEPQLGPSDAKAWLAFSQALDAGQPFSAALKAQESAKDSGRQAAMATVLAELAKIVPGGTKDDAVTPAMRAAASAAGRGIAQGLNKGTVLPWHFFPLSSPKSIEAPPAEPTPIVAGNLAATEARVMLASHGTTRPEPKPADQPPPKPPIRATKPLAREDGPPEWHWRTFVADPRVEAFGYLDADGVFRYTETRWRLASIPFDRTPGPFATNCTPGG